MTDFSLSVGIIGRRSGQTGIPTGIPTKCRDSSCSYRTAPIITLMSKSKSPVDEIKKKAFEAEVAEAIRTVYDPELPVNVYDLGLIYDIDIDTDAGTVSVRMTLTSPACPVAGELPEQVRSAIGKAVRWATDVDVEVVWDPPWTPDCMSDAARLELNL